MSSDPSVPPLSTDRTLRDVDLGCRIGFLVVTALLAYAAVYFSWLFYSLKVSNLYGAMFKGSPLPVTLQLAESGKSVWLQLSCSLPVVAAAAGLSIRRSLWALLTIAACNLGLALITIFLVTALFDGMGKIISSLS